MTDKRDNEKTVVHELDRAELAQVDGGQGPQQIRDGCGHIYWWWGKGDPPPSPGWIGIGPL